MMIGAANTKISRQKY